MGQHIVDRSLVSVPRANDRSWSIRKSMLLCGIAARGETLRFPGGLSLISSQLTKKQYPSSTFSTASEQTALAAAGSFADGACHRPCRSCLGNVLGPTKVLTDGLGRSCAVCLRKQHIWTIENCHWRLFKVEKFMFLEFFHETTTIENWDFCFVCRCCSQVSV